MTTTALLGTLALLALVDATSMGTLVIPLWLLLAARRPPVARLLLYLGVVVGLYFLIGLAVLLGAGFLLDQVRGALDSSAGYVVQVAVGVLLVVVSYLVEPADGGAARRARAAARAGETDMGRGADAPPAGSPRAHEWRSRIMASPWSVVGVAVACVGLEVATMLPYLGAIGLISAHAPHLPAAAGLLAAYCCLMVVPALGLLVLRLVAAERVERPLRRLEAWAVRSGSSAMAWILGIVGLVLAIQGIGELARRGFGG